MVLTKAELVKMLDDEVRILSHLAAKADPAQLDYRPTLQQRSTLDLLRYLSIMAPIHLRGVLADSFDMERWRVAWNEGEAAAAAMDLESVRTAIAGQSQMVAELLAPVSDSDLRQEIEMFGMKASRGSMLVFLVLSHYAAYRMQLFLHLKASGRPELNTMNLWMGVDAAAA